MPLCLRFILLFYLEWYPAKWVDALAFFTKRLYTLTLLFHFFTRCHWCSHSHSPCEVCIPERHRKTVRNINISDGRETTMVALWGPHADQFDAIGIQAASINGPVAVLFVGLTVGLYDGKLSLQGSTICQWYTNPPVPEIVALHNSFAGMPHEISWIAQRLINTPAAKTTMTNLSKLNAHDVVGLTYIVNVAIKSTVPHENWWHMSCTSCKRTIKQVGDEYICQRCPSKTVEPRPKHQT